MRQSYAGVALIRRHQETQTLWLAQWNPHWHAFNYVAGHKRSEESFRDCVAREVSEELGLCQGTEFEVAEEPLAHLEYTAWSESARAETGYTAEVFAVELTGALAG